MAVITLTTDLGLVDNYVASVKGAILKGYPEATIVDITHEIPAFDLQKSAFILRNCYQDFPEGTVHILGVNSEADVNVPHVALFANGHYFIGADNGVFSLIFDNPPEKVVELTLSQDTDRVTFPTKDVFVKAACHIARGGTLEVIGTAKYELSVRTMFRAVSDNNIIKGIATYIDHYGNVITNISESQFKNFGNGRPFKILFRSAEYEIDEISSSYSAVVEGERVAMFSSTGYIEIAINKANASKLFGINQGDTIRVEFYD
ncbi:MAG: SAM hydrolase/SAM-dependent halogenase family protein [Vicingaceae bacterium]